MIISRDNYLDTHRSTSSTTADSAWVTVAQSMGETFGSSSPDGSIPHLFKHYTTTGVQGTTVVTGAGTEVAAGRGRGQWLTYDATQGIVGGSVPSIVQDRRGHLWVGTLGVGANRFYGGKFDRFTTADGLPHDKMLPTVLDREGNLWFGSHGGASRYDGERFTNFSTADGLPSSRAWPTLLAQDGSIWFGGPGFVSRYDGKTFTNYSTEDGLPRNRAVFPVLEDRAGYIWLCIWGRPGGVLRFDGTTFTKFSSLEVSGNLSWRGISQDRNGHLWFATSEGLVRYDGDSFIVFTTQDGLAHNLVHAITEDAEGILWIGTHSGLNRYDGETFTSFDTRDGLAHDIVSEIFEDREGYLWFGTHGGGVSRYDRHVFTTFTTEDGLADNTVTAVLKDRDGSLWFGTVDGGVSRYDGRSFTTFSTSDGLVANGVSEILQDREGELWFSTMFGVSRYDGEHFVTFTKEDGLAGDQVEYMAEDGEGNLWFGTWHDGVSRYDGQQFTTFNRQDGIPVRSVTAALQADSGDLWFSTWGGGVVRYDGEGFETHTTRDGTAGTAGRSIIQDRDGNLWFAHWDGGVSRYDGQAFTAITPEDGLADIQVESVYQDTDGDLWFGTSGGGVSRFDGKTFQTLTTEDGLAGNLVYAITQGPEGEYWFATNNGVTRFRPPPPSPPTITIEAVVADRRYERMDELSIPTTLELTAFEFRGGNMKTRPGAVVFRYRLQGYHDDWRSTRDRRVEYENLPRGEYSFEVEAVDRDLVYSEEPATVKLTVHAPYERIGLYAALGVAAALIAWQTTRVVRRDRRLRESNKAMSTANKELFRVNQELEQATQHKSDFLAKMSHDLRTPMNAIIGYTRILLRRSKDILEERQYRNLENIQVSGNHFLELINDILDLSKIEADRMEVNLQAVELPALVNACVSAVESMVKPGVELRREVEEVEPVQTDPDRLRRVVNNLLSNAVKFTEEGSITVGLRTTDGQIELSVADTGVGIPAEELPGIFEEFRQVGQTGGGKAQGSGLGLAIAKGFAELLGGTISVTSEVGRGTAFTVRLNSGTEA